MSVTLQINNHCQFGWIVIVYSMAPDASHVQLFCVVVREDFSLTLANRTLEDMEKTLAILDSRPYVVTLAEAKKIVHEKQMAYNEGAAEGPSVRTLEGLVSAVKAFHSFKHSGELRKTDHM